MMLILFLGLNSQADDNLVRDPFLKPKIQMPSIEPKEIKNIVHEFKVIDESDKEIKKSEAYLTLNFDDVSVVELLELLAEFKGINLALSDEIKGNITLRLNHVRWEQALDTILTLQGLSKRWDNSVLFIAPEPALKNFSEQKLDIQPLETSLITAHYAKASDLAAQLQNSNHSLLSTHGHVIADVRTNALWIQDTPKNIHDIQKFVHALDIPVKQVSITAHVINIDEESMEELGLKFSTEQDNSQTDNGSLYMDTPLTIKDIGHFSLALAKLADNTLLNMELSALAREGRAEVISNPQLMTANQQTAIIESGQEIPYQENTSSGATNTAFKKAVLSLKVTPTILPNNKILLTLAVNQDNLSNLTVNGVPAISTQQIQTQVTVNHGETLVLGGIYEQTKNITSERIPFWSSIPLLGHLFSHKQSNHERKELLIFVTPSIVGT